MKTPKEAISLCQYVRSQVDCIIKYEGYNFEDYMNNVFLACEGYEDFFIKIYDEFSDKGVGLYRYSEVLAEMERCSE